MKVCAIRDEYENRNTVLGYLFYYERSRDFFIELRDDLDAGEFPILLSLFVQKRTYSIGREWSARWVQARIVPRDRQNLGAILRDNGLSEYDPYRLLILGNGRCSQDECAVFPVREAELPEWLHRRRQKKAAGVASLSGRRMLVSFRDGAVALADLKKRWKKTDGLLVSCGKMIYFLRCSVCPEDMESPGEKEQTFLRNGSGRTEFRYH